MNISKVFNNQNVLSNDKNLANVSLERYSEIATKYYNIFNWKDEDIKEYLKEVVTEMLKPKGVCDYININMGNKEKAKNIYFGKNYNNIEYVYDLASITKTFLGIIYIYLMEKGYVYLDKEIGFYSNKYVNIKSLIIKDVLSYNVNLKTTRRIDTCKTYEEANSILELIYGHYSPMPIYSDLPSIILAELLIDITKKDFSTWIDELIIKPLELKNTHWRYDKIKSVNCVEYNNEVWLIDGNILPVTNIMALPHDPKARILSNNGTRLCGNAGLFSSASDMGIIARYILSEGIVTKNGLKKMINGNGWDNKSDKQSYGFLCYRKYANKVQSEVYEMLSDGTIATSGYTGCYFFLDIVNDVFGFIGANRLTQAITRVVNTEIGNDPLVILNYKDNRDYVYKRDKLKNMISEMSLCF